jgi:GNAT superfamily N-acetyltransferase
VIGREVMSSTAHSRREDTGAIRSRGQWVIREFDAVGDADAVSRIDTSYTSDQVYAVHRSGDVVALAPTSITVPHSKREPVDLAGPWTHGRVALLDDRVRGFIAWGFEAWNRRMTIGPFHVDRPYRRRGGGRGLVEAALDWARRTGVLTAWIETSSVNHAAIAAYRRLGFEICGFDTTLYRGTPNQGEVAVYMARLIDSDARPHAG